jgi:hypothetical protein
MNRPSPPSERGSVLVISLIVLLGLMSLGAVAVLSARTESRTSGIERGERVALFAAEAGVAAAQEYLRQPDHCSPTTGLDPLDGSPLPRDLPNNTDDKPPLSDPDATYSVTFYKEGTCDGTLNADKVACVAIRSTGQGPGGATALVRLQLSRKCEAGASTATAYAQRDRGTVANTDIDNTQETSAVPDAGM